ncbi:MAG: hypothetical protein ABL958_07050, partial [Bdellovibrionia bacterium]
MEGGAINKATGSPGYGSDGKPLPVINTPKSDWILSEYPKNQEVKMTWDHLKFGPQLAPLVEALGYKLEIHKGARPDNNYICNNLSFIAAHAASGNAIELAGGKIQLGPAGEDFVAPKIGFLHVPTVDAEFTTPKAATSRIFGLARFVLSFAALSLGLDK